MFFKWRFKYYSERKKILLLKEGGILLGIRYRNGRKVYLYSLKDFFIEVLHQQDNVELEPENLETFSSLSHLNSYLEKEFRTAF